MAAHPTISQAMSRYNYLNSGDVTINNNNFINNSLTNIQTAEDGTGTSNKYLLSSTKVNCDTENYYSWTISNTSSIAVINLYNTNMKTIFNFPNIYGFALGFMFNNTNGELFVSQSINFLNTGTYSLSICVGVGVGVGETGYNSSQTLSVKIDDTLIINNWSTSAPSELAVASAQFIISKPFNVTSTGSRILKILSNMPNSGISSTICITGLSINRTTNNEYHIFNCTKADQTFTVPSDAMGVIIQCWGAGGATPGYDKSKSNNYHNAGDGGNGGFVQAMFDSTIAGKTLNIIVGEGGKSYAEFVITSSPYGGGGFKSAKDNRSFDYIGSASGGGRSEVKVSTDIIVTAGGGGGGGGGFRVGGSYNDFYTGELVVSGGSGGSGSSLNGVNGILEHTGVEARQTFSGGQGEGGTLSSGGVRGSQSTTFDGNGMSGIGGNTTYVTGGGGGYYGGGGGGFLWLWNEGNQYIISSGGGGSSYVSTMYGGIYQNLLINDLKISDIPVPIKKSNIGKGGSKVSTKEKTEGSKTYTLGNNGEDGLVIIIVKR